MSVELWRKFYDRALHDPIIHEALHRIRDGAPREDILLRTVLLLSERNKILEHDNVRLLSLLPFIVKL